MSADNLIAVMRCADGRYLVRMALMSPLCEDDGYVEQMLDEGRGELHPTREAALVAAHDMQAREQIVEYGVMELGPGHQPSVDSAASPAVAEPEGQTVLCVGKRNPAGVWLGKSSRPLDGYYVRRRPTRPLVIFVEELHQ